MHYEKEAKAYSAFQKWLDDASQLRKQFEECGSAIPAPLARLMGLSSERQPPVTRMLVPPPQGPGRPPEAQDDWIWVTPLEAVETTLVLAILRQKGGPMAYRDLFAQIVRFQPDANEGSIHNIGSRLVKQGTVSRGPLGWDLIDKAKAPLLVAADGDEYLWGPSRIFQKPDLAAYRRTLIVHILSAARGGLMNMQIVEQLTDGEFCHAPASKDLVKMDLLSLQEQGVVKRVGNTKKYRLTKDRKESA